MIRDIIGKEVYIKFGRHHGKKAKVIRETTKKGELAFVLLVDDHMHVIKKQKNTVILGN